VSDQVFAGISAGKSVNRFRLVKGFAALDTSSFQAGIALVATVALSALATKR
jgi:hypothetical protein